MSRGHSRRNYVAQEGSVVDERLALLAVGLLKSRVIEDAQRNRVRLHRAMEAEEARHRAIKGRRRPRRPEPPDPEGAH